MSNSKKLVKWRKIFFMSAIITTILATIGLGCLYYLSQDLPSLDQIEQFDPAVATQIISHDGVVLKKLMVQDRLIANYNELPKSLVHALIAMEDRRFYDHWGTDLYGLTRAVVKFVLGGFQRVRGTSTITQQLARNLYDKVGMKRSIFRKIKEAITAVQIERTHSKDEIIAMYLSTVYIGHGAYGVKAAAKKYFDKEVGELTLDESAMLIGLLPAPGKYSPINFLDRATKKRNIILKKMYEQKFITRDEYSYQDSITTIVLAGEPPGSAPYFTEIVRQKIDPKRSGVDIDPYKDGLTIYTTLDSRIQNHADSAVANVMNVNQGRLFRYLLDNPEESALYNFIDTSMFSVDTLDLILRKNCPIPPELSKKLEVQCAVVVLDNRNGKIRAMVGGRDFDKFKFNRATQAERQPGSVFKPLLYTQAIMDGIPISKRIMNLPVVIKWRDKPWIPKNYDESSGGKMDLRTALRKSVNLVAVNLAQKIQVADPKTKKISTLAHKMGITTHVPDVDAIALGVASVIPLEMTAAYSIFPNQGILHVPVYIDSVTNRYGKTLPLFDSARSKEVLDKNAVYLMTNLMEGVVNNGTGGTIRWKYKFYRPAGGKTGTTNNWTDAWFIGYTKEFTAGVWVGMDDPQVSLGEGQSGSKTALPIWAEIMKTIYADSSIVVDYKIPENSDLSALTKDSNDFWVNLPDNIEASLMICKDTGKLSLGNCDEYNEIFIRGTEPTKICDRHR